jgi:hypothetical protein
MFTLNYLVRTEEKSPNYGLSGFRRRWAEIIAIRLHLNRFKKNLSLEPIEILNVSTGEFFLPLGHQLSLFQI